MKKLGLVGGLVIVVAIMISIISANQMGEKSHAFAQGRVVLAPHLQSIGQHIPTLFIVLSNPDRPMPLGAIRKTIDPSKGGTIYEFKLTRDNMQMMMENIAVPPRFKLKARLDLDGQAGPDQPGDLVGEILDVEEGRENIEIVISKVVE